LASSAGEFDGGGKQPGQRGSGAGEFDGGRDPQMRGGECERVERRGGARKKRDRVVCQELTRFIL
jgi:hypothetical protein